MMLSSGVAGGVELHAHGFGLLREVVQNPLVIPLLEVVLHLSVYSWPCVRMA